MTSPFILWALLSVALVKVRSDEVPLDNLESENYWDEVTISGMEQSASKTILTDLKNQNDVENGEAIFSRSGLDELSLSVGSSQLSDSEAMNLGIALGENNLLDASDTSNLMGRLSGMEANKSPDTNYENLANLRASIDPIASSSDIDSQNELNMKIVSRMHDTDDHASLSDLHKEGMLTLMSRSGYNDLNPINVGVNVGRLNTLNGLKSGDRGHLNGLHALNEAGINSANVDDNVYVVKSGSLNDVLRNNLNNFNNMDMTQKIARTGSLKANDALRNDLRVSNCNNINSQGVSRISTNDFEDALNAHNLNNQRNMVNANLDRKAPIDNNRKSLVLEGVNRHDKSSNVNSVGAQNSLELNALDSKALNRNPDKELANLIESVKADRNGLKQLDPINSLELDRVSLNSLNKAKKLLGPLNLNRGLSDRSNSEVDEELFDALNIEGDFNALGALVVLSKIAEKPNSLRALNEVGDYRNSRNVNARNEMEKNIDLNLLKSLGAPDDVSKIDELASSNPLPHILDNLYNLARVDSASDDEKELNPQNSLKSSTENRNSLDQSNSNSRSESNFFESESDNEMNNSPNRASSLENNRSSKLGMDRRGLYIPYRSTRPIRRPNNLYKLYRPSKPLNIARYLYQPRASSGLSEGQNLNSLDSDKLSSTLLNDNNLNSLNDNIPIVSLRENRNDYSLNELLSSTDKNYLNVVSVDVNEAQRKSPNAHHSMNIGKGVDRKNNLNGINQFDSEGSMRSPTNLNNVREGNNLLRTNADSTQLRSPANLNVKLLNKEDVNALNNLVPLPVMLNSDLNRAEILYGLVHLNNMN